MPSADPKRVLTGNHYLDGDHACTEGALSAGCNFVAGYPITPSTEVVERFAAPRSHRRRHLHPDGGRDRLDHRRAGRGLGRGQGHDRHLGPGLQPDDGEHRPGRHARDALRGRQRAARRTLDGPAHHGGPGRHDAGALGLARRLRDHRPGAPVAPGGLLPDHRRPSTCPSSTACR